MQRTDGNDSNVHLPVNRYTRPYTDPFEGRLLSKKEEWAVLISATTRQNRETMSREKSKT